MVIHGYEWGILRDLIGKKAEAVIVPTAANSVSDPVEAILVLSDHKGILFDSCSRKQKPTETMVNYPQMRVRVIDEVPEYKMGQRIELNENGEIIKRVEIVNEEVLSPSDFVDYTKAIHIEFSGDRDVTITRETFRNPSLQICEKPNWKDEVQVSNPYGILQFMSL
ncbi:MAG: hypothetical protein HUJ55_01500 [Ileibacterium sp.]|nr:hypothetical protein [Ileibacterium sp.]